MKKLAIGCFLVVVLLAIAGGIASYWVYRKVATTVSQVSELGTAPEIERQVRNTTPFAEPADGALTADQVERLVQVQGTVRQRLGARFTEMEQKYRALFEKKDATLIDAPAIVAAYRDLAATWLEAKRAQVDALNAARFSLEEYRWVRRASYAAMGLPIMNFDVSRMIEDLKSGVTPGRPSAEVEGSFGPTGPEANKALVEPHKKALEENAALAAFGL